MSTIHTKWYNMWYYFCYIPSYEVTQQVILFLLYCLNSNQVPHFIWRSWINDQAKWIEPGLGSHRHNESLVRDQLSDIGHVALQLSPNYIFKSSWSGSRAGLVVAFMNASKFLGSVLETSSAPSTTMFFYAFTISTFTIRMFFGV